MEFLYKGESCEVPQFMKLCVVYIKNEIVWNFILKESNLHNSQEMVVVLSGSNLVCVSTK
jgi:hypothetical protein